MGEVKSVKLEKRQLDGIEAIQQEGQADNQSEALRNALDAGLQELGYYHGEKRDTRLRALARRFGDAFGLLGLMWIGVTMFLPVGIRVYAAAPFAASLACIALDRGLATVEPSVSNRLVAFAATLIGGEKA